jgi:hypothetical protein
MTWVDVGGAATTPAAPNDGLLWGTRQPLLPEKTTRRLKGRVDHRRVVDL